MSGMVSVFLILTFRFHKSPLTQCQSVGNLVTSHQVIGLTLLGRSQIFSIHLNHKLIKITFSFPPLFLILISDSMEHILNELEDLFQSLVRRMNKSEMEDFELVIIIF